MGKENTETVIEEYGQRAKKASRVISQASTEKKNAVLITLANLLNDRKEEIFKVNLSDVSRASSEGLSQAFIDRLTITEKILTQMINGLKQIASLKDPVGEISNLRPQPSGIVVGQMRVPLGVVAIIFESRPNVTIDAAALCIKSGNAAILRGGSDARDTNALLSALIAESLAAHGLPADTVQVIVNPDRELVGALITCKQYVDVLVPRGGKGLISRLMKEATVPMIKHLEGVCHTFVDASADIELAISVCDNAKTQRYSPCNAMETLLVHQAVAEQFLPRYASILAKKGVELRSDPLALELLNRFGIESKLADESDWYAEYNAPILSIKILSGLDEAIEHINHYGSHHTDAIITNDLKNSECFLKEVDSSSVMINTSTRFADGFEYGLGAEIGISTDKLHARGPVGLEGLTSQKYIVYGHGELRH